MASLTGLFRRGGSYYLRVMLPTNHPLSFRYNSGKIVCSLGKCSYKDALRIGTQKRAELLWNFGTSTTVDYQTNTAHTQDVALHSTAPKTHITLRHVFTQWKTASKRSADTISSANRSLTLFESLHGQPSIGGISRAMGVEFKAKLLELPTSSKTADNKFSMVNSLLKYAFLELELIHRNPWTGLSIRSTVTNKREPWSNEMLVRLFSHPIWSIGAMPKDKKAGNWAAYWIPLLGLYTGARSSELCQLKTSDINFKALIPTIKITNEGSFQKLKSESSARVIPIHKKLIQLGFLEYTKSIKNEQLWPGLPFRQERAGGYFSQWFSTLRQSLQIPRTMLFHSFRHTFRSKLVEAKVPEPVIDQILGHASHGSIGARVYTHISIEMLNDAVQSISYVIELSSLVSDDKTR